jgi:hypothetical protein
LPWAENEKIGDFFEKYDKKSRFGSVFAAAKWG